MSKKNTTDKRVLKIGTDFVGRCGEKCELEEEEEKKRDDGAETEKRDTKRENKVTKKAKIMPCFWCC